MIMSCCSSTPSSSSHLHKKRFSNQGFSKTHSSKHVTIPPKPLPTLPYIRTPSASGKDPGGDQLDTKPRSTRPYWRSSSTAGKGPAGHKDSQYMRLYEDFLHLEGTFSKGQAPDPAQSTELLYRFCRIRKLLMAVRVVEMTAAATGCPPSRVALNHLIKQLCQCGKVGHAVQLVDKMESVYGLSPDISTCNLLVRGFCIHGNLLQNLKLLERMIRSGLEPDSLTFSYLVGVACKERGADEAERLLEEIVAKGWRPNMDSYHIVLSGFCSVGRLDDAVRLFRSLISRGFQLNVKSYTILIRGFCDYGRWDESEKLMAEMAASVCRPTISVYRSLASSFAVYGRIADALKVIDKLAYKGSQRMVVVEIYNEIIERLCRDGNVAAAKDFLDSMIHRHRLAPSIFTYLAVTQLCECRPGLVHKMFDILQELCIQQQGAPTDDFFRDIVAHLCLWNRAVVGVQLLSEMVRKGFTPDGQTYSLLLRGLCSVGMMDEALAVMGVMEEEGIVSWGIFSRPNVHNYNGLVIGLCRARRTDLALEVYARMVDRGVMPNDFTYETLVEGIAEEGELKLAADMLMELYRRDVVSKKKAQVAVLQNDLEELVDKQLFRNPNPTM